MRLDGRCTALNSNRLLEFSFQHLRKSVDGLAGFTLEKNQFRILREFSLDLLEQFLVRLVQRKDCNA